MYFATVFSSEAATLLVKHGFRSALELEIKTTTRLGNFSGLMQIMGLSSAMGCKISMVYPDKRHSMLPLLAGTYNPRQLTLSATTTLCLMWTDMGGWPDRSKIFKVNHFVLMATVNEEWHVISRRRKSRVENFTKPNLPQRNYSVADMVPPAKKCNKFEEAPPNFAKSNDSLTKSSSKKPTHTKPALTKPTRRNSFPATMKPVSKKPISGNITCSKIPTKSSLKTPTSRKPITKSVLTKSPQANHVQQKSIWTNPTHTKPPVKTSTTPSPIPTISNPTKPNPANPTTTNPTLINPTSTNPTPTKYTYRKPNNGKPTSAIPFPEKSGSTKPIRTHYSSTGNDPTNSPFTNQSDKKPPSTKPGPTKQTCLKDYFQTNRKDCEMSTCNTLETETPETKPLFSKHPTENVSPFAFLTASYEQVKGGKLKNVPKFTKEVPLAFNVQTFHNDETISILSNEPSGTTGEKTRGTTRDRERFREISEI